MATTKRPFAEQDLRNKDPSQKSLSNNVTSSPPDHQRGFGNKTSDTRVIIKYDVGFKNTLYIRGNGANLNWTKGIPLKNVKADEWLWEPEVPFSHCEFKVLINDSKFEAGENHHLNPGMKIQFTPNF